MHSVCKPAVVEQEQVHTEAACLFHEVGKNLLVEVEGGVLPVVEQRHACALAVFEAVVSRPFMDASTTF